MSPNPWNGVNAVLSLHFAMQDEDGNEWCSYCAYLDDDGVHTDDWTWPCVTVSALRTALGQPEALR